MKIYAFNKHNVCTNPDVIRIDGWVKVEVAQCGEGAWVYGFTAHNGGSPCMRGILVYPTKDDAIREGLKHLIRWLSKDAQWFEKAGRDYSADLRCTRAVLKLAEEELRNRTFVQQTLF